MMDPRKTMDIKARVRADQGERLRQLAEERFGGNLSAALREALDLAERAVQLRESADEAWRRDDGDPHTGLSAYDIYVFLGGEARLRDAATGAIVETIGPPTQRLRESERLREAGWDEGGERR